tara:strand:- start:837 stop:2825 length:1989 start_codon:yes stop_codon:yes gene_type:complete
MQNYNMLNRAANSINTLEGDRHIKQNAINKVESDFQRTIEVGNFENAGRVVGDATNDFIGNRGLQLAQQSYSSRQQELKVIDQLRANGKQVLDFNEIRNENGEVIGHRTDAHSSYHQDPNTGKMVENVYRPGSEMQLDYTQRMESLLAGIAKSGGGKMTKSDIAGYVKYITSQGVSRSRAHKVVEAALGAYIDTDEGTQDYRRLTEIEGMSDGDAKLDMINRMQGVVEKQIASITSPHYMKAPEGGSGFGYNGQGYDYAGGQIVRDEGLEDYTSLKTNLRDLTEKLDTHPKGSDKYNSVLDEIRATKEKMTLTTDAVSHSHPEIKASLETGNKALGKYQDLQSMFFNMTTKTGWKPTAFWSTVGDFFTGNIGTFQERGVSNIWASDNVEKGNLKFLFDRDGVIEHINKTHGTNYTEADLPGIKKAAENYLEWMQKEGDDTYDKIDDLTTIKQSDRIVYALDNTKQQNAANTHLKQFQFSDFNFQFSSDDERIAAKEAWDADAKQKGAEGRKDQIQFAGMTIPSLNETGKLLFYLNGKLHIATPKSGDLAQTITSGLYDSLGATHMSQTHELAQAYERGELDNGGLIDQQLQHIYHQHTQMNTSEKDFNAVLQMHENRVANWVQTGLGITQEDWNNMSREEQAVHFNTFRKQKYNPNVSKTLL